MSAPRIDQIISTAAALTDCILTWPRMRDLGVSPCTIRRLIRDGWMHHLGSGTYLVGTNAITPRGRLRAAVESSGSSSMLTGPATLFLVGVVSRPPRTIDVLVRSQVKAMRGVSTRRYGSVPDAERMTRDGIRSASVERALVDMSPDHDPLRLLKHMRNARYHSELDCDLLRGTIDRLRNRGGTDSIRRALMYFERGDGGADSALEERFHRMVLGAGFKDPRSNVHVPGLLACERVDFVWEAEGLVVEVDGPHHLDETVRLDDARRDRALRAHGWRVIRFWWWEIEEQPAQVLARLGAALT